MKRTITAAIILAAILCTTTLAACAQATASQEPEKPATEFHYVHDWSEPKEPNGAVRIVKEKAERDAARQAEEEARAEAEQYAEYYEQIYYAPADNGDGFVSQGVREFNGTTETWYSSNQAYHYRTSEWTPDEEGYYRDEDGYYVVASEDHAEGEVFETSKGEARVYDGGCESGTVDFYVNF